MSTRKITLEDGNGLLLEGGTDFLIKDGVAQASDDVLLRLGPGLTATTGSGLLAPNFIPGTPGAPTVVFGGYYRMMQQWFEAA